MPDIIRCDGGCGAESPDPKTGNYLANHWMTLIVRREGSWEKHRLCKTCEHKNVFLPGHGESVSTHGFASDVLR